MNYSYLIKPASSACNMKCKYCFYHDVVSNREVRSYGNMLPETMHNIISKTLDVEDNAQISYAFQGGEPTLVGLDYFKAFIHEVEQTKKDNQTIVYSLQTNGTLLDDEWVQFLKDNDFLIGLSLDGYKENHDYFRITNQNTDTYKRVLNALSLLRKYDVTFNVLTVLTDPLAKHPQKLYNFYKELGLTHVQLIPCLPELSSISHFFALTPKRFASFYKTFYDLWLNDFKQGNYLSVGLFDNIIPMYRGIPPQMCGMVGNCAFQFVIESDGSVYPCDFYVLDEYKCGNINTENIRQIAKNKMVRSFIEEPKRMCKACDTCPFFEMCRGNCKRLNITYFDDEYCGYQEFLLHSETSMREIAAQIKLT